MRKFLVLAVLAVTSVSGEAASVAEDDQIRAIRRHGDLLQMESDRLLEEHSQRIRGKMRRSAATQARRRGADRMSARTVSHTSGSATVEGVVKDEDGTPIPNVEVRADFEAGGGTWTKTDTAGAYEMAVTAGKLWVRLSDNDLIPMYLRPRDREAEVEDGATISVDFTAYASDATISGTVLLDGAALANIGLSADGRVGYTRTETGSEGTFTLHVASEGDAAGGYNLWVNTHDLATDAFRTERYEGITSGTADLTINLVTATSFIEGTVADDAGTAVADVTIYANQHHTGNHVSGVTGSDGSFKLEVIAGRWWLDLDAGQMMPDYLVPHGEEVDVTDGATTTHSFTVYATDAAITGTITFDGAPISDVHIGASSELGWTEAVSDSTGGFSLSVSSVADDEGGYNLWVHDWSVPRGAVIEESYRDVVSGSSGIDFHIVSPNSFIEGKVIDDAGAVFADLRVWADREGESGGYSETRTNAEGYFKLGVAAGRWRVNVDGWELWGTHLAPDGVDVSVSDGSTVTRDIVLLTADATITGTVFLDGSPLAGIGVEARSRWGWTQDNTASDGTFSLAVSSVVDERGGYHVYVHDWELGDDLFHLEEHWNVTSGSAGVNFRYVYADAFVEGEAVDEDGAPIADVRVYANSDQPPWNWTETETDAAGAFKLGLIGGDWWVRLEAWDLMPHYLVPRDSLVTVSSGETVSLRLSAVSTDATITGTVTLDGSPLPEIEVRADTHLGWTETRTDESGLYALHVASEADAHRGYNVWMETWRLPDSTYVEKNWYQDVLSGSTDRDFHVYKTKSGFKGQILSAKTEKPVHHAWVWAWDGVNQWGQNAGVERTGRFKMWVPNGTYDVYASGDGYEEQLVARSVTLDDEVMEYTIYLEGEGPPLSVNDGAALPKVFALHPNTPNPFNPETTISFDIPERSEVQLTVYDLLGRKITVLSDGVAAAGSYTIRWDGRDTFGHPVSSGVYILHFQAGETSPSFSQTRKMLLLK